MSIFCSWSGGKDSTLALWHGLKMFGKVEIPSEAFTVMLKRDN